ncbi:MAG: D-mannonate dehydratase [Caldilineae bacterium]|nr:MAG: D-mannonate dehydratase [Caldilineae bacterium]
MSLMPVEPGMHIAAQVSPEADDEELAFVKQMGVDYAVCWTDGQHASYEYYARTKERFEKAGIKIYGFGNRDVHNQDKIVLGLPGRDEKIEEYINHLRALGRAGIPYTTYAHMANGIWSTERETTRGGASARAFNLDKATVGHWHGREYPLPLSHGRVYSQEEIWENFRYFIRQAAPVAEEEGVRIGIHPDDPPLPELAGVPRCIFSSYAGYKRALEIADSPNVGICFCVGCWLEGGELMGKGIIESLTEFIQQGKVFKVHFRNVDKPLPYFVETFVDDGYQDMYQVLKAMKQAGFNGVFIPDHIPNMANDRRVATAFTIGYMKAMLDRVEAEG